LALVLAIAASSASPSPDNASSNVKGSFNFPHLQFDKVYYKGERAPVHYEGKMSSSGKSITGSWELPPLGRGTWIAWRVEEEEGCDRRSLYEKIKKEHEAERPLVQSAPGNRP
jgi:hypothetical protein